MFWTFPHCGLILTDFSCKTRHKQQLQIGSNEELFKALIEFSYFWHYSIFSLLPATRQGWECGCHPKPIFLHRQFNGRSKFGQKLEAVVKKIKIKSLKNEICNKLNIEFKVDSKGLGLLINEYFFLGVGLGKEIFRTQVV